MSAGESAADGASFNALEPPPGQPTRRYDAFLSYSSQADDAFAPALEKGLEQLAKPWWRRRALDVFLDETGLAVTPGLWSTICEALDGSDHFVLLASPSAAESEWVGKEIRRWVESRGVDRLLVVVTDGEWVWDKAAGDFDWDRSTAAHRALAGVFQEEPRHADMRWARTEELLTLRHGRFRDHVAEVAAPMHGVTKDKLVGEDIRQQRRSRRIAIGVVTLLTILTVVAFIAASVAIRQTDIAREQRNVAIARGLVAESEILQNQDPTLSRLLAATAWRLDPSGEARFRMLSSVTAPSRATILADVTATRSIAFSPDGDNLAVVGENVNALGRKRSFVQLWDMATRRPIIQTIESDSAPIASVAFSPDSQILATGHEDGTVLLWDIAPGELISDTFEGHHDRVFAVVFSPDGQTLAAGSEEGAVRLWDVATGELIGDTFDSSVISVGSVAFSPDSQILAVGQDNGTVLLWDVDSGRQKGALIRAEAGEPSNEFVDFDETNVLTVMFSPDGQTLATASDDETAQLWDVATGTLISDPFDSNVTRSSVGSVALSPDGQTLASSGSIDGQIRLWDIATGTPLGNELEGNTGSFESLLSFSPDGQILATGGGIGGTVRLLEINGGPRPVHAPLDGHGDGLWALSFSPDGQILATGSEDGTVLLWDIATGKPIGNPLEGHDAPVYSVAFSPDGELLATGSDDTTARLWDMTTGAPIGEPLEGHDSSVWSMAFSPDGRILATGSELDTTPRLWDASTGEPMGNPLPDHIGGFTSMAFSPDGELLATGSRIDGQVRLWDVATGTLIRRTPEGHDSRVTSLVFSPDGAMLATGSNDSTVMLWDPSAGGPTRIGDPLEGHTGWIYSVAFSPDGRTIATGSGDGTARLWDVATGQPIGDPITGHRGHIPFFTAVSDRVTSVALSPDGKTLATGSHDSTARLWDVSFLTQDPEDLACERAGRSLTEEEWERYVPDLPFRHVC